MSEENPKRPRQTTPIPSNHTQLPLECIHDCPPKTSTPTHPTHPTLHSTPTFKLQEGFDQEDAKNYFRTIVAQLGRPVSSFRDLINDTTGGLAALFSSDQDDINVIQSQIKTVLSILVSVLVTLNLYYLMFFRISPAGGADGPGVRPPRMDLTMATLESKHPILCIFLLYNLVSMSFLDQFLMDKIPYYMDLALYMVPNLKPSLLFLFLFVLVCRLVYNYGENVVDAFVNAAELQMDDLSGMFIFLMFVYAAVALVYDQGFVFNMLRNVMTGYFWIPMLFLFLIRILLLSIPFVFLSGLTVYGYLLAISFLAIPYYTGGRIAETVRSIFQFMYQDLDKEPNSCSLGCDSWAIWGILRKMLKMPIRFLLKYIIHIMIVVALLHAIQEYISKMEGESMVQHVMISLSVFLILAIVGREIYIVYEAYLKAKREETPRSVESYLSEPRTKTETPQSETQPQTHTQSQTSSEKNHQENTPSGTQDSHKSTSPPPPPPPQEETSSSSPTVTGIKQKMKNKASGILGNFKDKMVNTATGAIGKRFGNVAQAVTGNLLGAKVHPT